MDDFVSFPVGVLATATVVWKLALRHLHRCRLDGVLWVCTHAGDGGHSRGIGRAGWSSRNCSLSRSWRGNNHDLRLCGVDDGGHVERTRQRL